MFTSQRVFISDGGTLTDVTLDLNDFREGNASAALTTDDYIYIASERPFNSRYFKLTPYNAESATVSIEIWGSNGWFSAVDVVDETKGFNEDGYIRFNLDRDNRRSWTKQDDSKNVTDVGSQVDVFEMYWLRVSFSTDLSGTTALRHIGTLFSSDDDLFSYYPDLRNSGLMAAWETGKADWIEQGFSAANEILRELRRKSITFGRAGFSLMDVGLYNEASIHKTAQIIYAGLGESFDAPEAKAAKAFREALDMTYHRVDVTGDGTLSQGEKKLRTGFTRR